MKKAEKLAWKSAEHYLKNWQDPYNASTKGIDCELCKEYGVGDDEAQSECLHCPIAIKIGDTECLGTPWGNASGACHDLRCLGYSKLRFQKAKDTLEAEYRFLVELALELSE